METNVIEQVFGKDVFNDDVMQAKLPKDVYKSWKKTLESGADLDLDIAKPPAKLTSLILAVIISVCSLSCLHIQLSVFLIYLLGHYKRIVIKRLTIQPVSLYLQKGISILYILYLPVNFRNSIFPQKGICLTKRAASKKASVS